jgi:hypothetical protein
VSRSALGGFVSGLQGGLEFADTRRRNRAINNVIDRENDEYDLNREAKLAEWIKGGNEASEFPQFNNPANDDPFLVRGFNWLKNKFGSGGAPDTTALVSPESPQPQQRSAIPAMADGGMINDPRWPRAFDDEGNPVELSEEDRMVRSYGPDNYVRESEAQENRDRRTRGDYYPIGPVERTLAGRQPIRTTGGGISEFAGDFARHTPGLFDDTVAVAREGANEREEAKARLDAAEGARETGTAIRGVAGSVARSGLGTGAAIAKDVLVDNPITQGVLGFIGFDGTRDRRQPDPNTPTEKPQPAGGEPARAAIQEAVGQEPSDQVAEKAIQTGVENTPGHPDNPDQAFDWEEVASTGVSPDEIPHVGVKDWAEYRRQAGRAAALRGETHEAAMERVTQMQMQGAQSNLMQAAFLLRSGNQRGAALAARAAFQYFPNGSDVRLGTYEGPNGPVLVGMGVDEETGEPIKEGKPMILNPEIMATMAENFSNPSAFRTWTKDWREMEQDVREYEEVRKPEAQSSAIYRDRMGQAAVNNSLAARDRARSGGGAPSVKESDFRASFEAQTEQLFTAGVDEQDLSRMETIANRIRQSVPSQQQLSDAQIVNMVLRFYETGDSTELEAYLPASSE